MGVLKLNQAGAGHIVAVFVLVFIGVVSFAGYKVATMNQLSDNAPIQAVADDDLPVSIATPADLDRTSAALDNDSNLTASLDDSKLDADLDAML